jgi:hypothetical protein
MMSVEPGILDANVLAYAINADAAQHTASRGLLEAARDPSIKANARVRLCTGILAVDDLRPRPHFLSTPS